jgi:D-alanine-D-alanine ligase
MINNKVVIFFNKVSENAKDDELDILEQVKIVNSALIELGYETFEVALSLDLNSAINQINEINPHFVFNLVESINNTGELLYFAPALLNYLKIPYTGVHLDAMFITTNKLLSKKILSNAGIPTPPWIELDNTEIIDPSKRYILKPNWEDGSLGLDEDSVFYGFDKEFIAKLKSYDKRKYFIEEYIDGREFNISVLGGKPEPEVMPAAEMKFLNYADDKPKVMGYSSKWIENSFEYNNTRRTFDFIDDDKNLITRLNNISVRCWKALSIVGYIRVDIRVDFNNNPFVLEINSNPCISDSGGFYAATENAGYKFTEVIERIIYDALH